MSGFAARRTLTVVRSEHDAQPGFRQVSSRPLRIALFSGNYNCVRDGANQALNRLVAHLLERTGARVRIYSPTAREAAFPPTGDLVSVPSIGIPGRPEYRLALGMPGAIRRDLEDFAPDIVHLSAPDLLGRSAQRHARKLGIPVVASLHTRFETYLDYYGLRTLRNGVEHYLQRFYADSDRVLAPNAPIADELRAAGLGDRVVIWGRGVDRTIFTPTLRDPAWRRSLGYDEDDVVILFFGRAVREKGLDMFAQTIETIRSAGHRVRPLVVGDGPGRDAFARQIGNATFLGHLTGQTLGRAVASADIMLNPSVTEAFGNVTLEAMAAGLAIISADAPSARALIDNGRTGLLVSPETVDAYATPLIRLIDSPDARAMLGRAAAAEAARYEWADILEDVVHVYRGCLSSPTAHWPSAA